MYMNGAAAAVANGVTPPPVVGVGGVNGAAAVGGVPQQVVESYIPDDPNKVRLTAVS